MSSSFFGSSPSVRTRHTTRRRTSPRLGLESLETRRVLATTITGSVVIDSNANGAIENGEPGHAGVAVYVDGNGNGQLDITGDIVEPDDYTNKEVIDGSSVGATFRVADETNVPLVDAPTVVSFVDPLASTGDSVFGWTRGINDTPFFNSFFRLRIDFDAPVSSVKLDFISSIEGRETGVLEAYNAAGTLVDTYETADLARDNFETMHVVRSQGDIAYVTAFTKRTQLTGRLDSLRINGAESENWTLTDSDGAYELHVNSGGTYTINEVVPDGFQRTLPTGTAGSQVTVATDQISTGNNFANASLTNQNPVAANDLATTAEDSPVTINVLANDTDDTGLNPATVTIASGPSRGTASINTETGAITYTPEANYFGSDLIRYTVRDTAGVLSNLASVTINVTSVNDAPEAVNDEATTTAGASVVIGVLDNDRDIDSSLDEISVTIINQPANGTASVNSLTGEVTYTPDAGFAGVDSFEYTVSDTEGLESNEANVTVTVESAGGSWQNPINRFDIDNDGFVFPIDALLIINELNQPAYRDPVTGELPAPPNPVPAFFDVDGDGFVSPTDAILVINVLNSAQNGNGAVAAVAATSAEAEPVVDTTDVAAATGGRTKTMAADDVDAAFACV